MPVLQAYQRWRFSSPRVLSVTTPSNLIHHTYQHVMSNPRYNLLVNFRFLYSIIPLMEGLDNPIYDNTLYVYLSNDVYALSLLDHLTHGRPISVHVYGVLGISKSHLGVGQLDLNRLISSNVSTY